jgi:dipeptidyl aminopeptidase/acylaminoacyl peptidase
MPHLRWKSRPGSASFSGEVSYGLGMAKAVLPYGSWPSPISIEQYADAGHPFFSYVIAGFDGDGVLWLEERPAEGGRAALLRGVPGAPAVELTPPDFNARTRVHEYGGGAVCFGSGAVLASSFDDGRLYRLEDRVATPVTPESPKPNALRYADGCIAGDSVTCVRESHGAAVVNDLVAFPVDGSSDPEVVHAGRDFYSTPRIDARGRLAYLAWDHPLLPFLGTELWCDGKRLAGGADEAVFQPEWGPDGALWWVSDRDGWWNLYRDGEQVTHVEADLGVPAWVFGLRTYAFLGDGRIVATVVNRAVHTYALVDPADGSLQMLELPFSASAAYVHAHGNRFTVIAGTPQETPGIHVVDADTETYETLRTSWTGEVAPQSISLGRPIEFESHGRTSHAFYYPPASADHEGPADELPPLFMVIHGGPTAQGHLCFDAFTQFLTSRGWGVVDVNYGGSTGFGRAYRELLHEAWGVVDVEDCVAAARHLADAGEVDAARLAIGGGSAGGFTALLALATSDVFAAGTSAFGVTDLVSFCGITHKFEERYMDWLLGPLPEKLDVYRERSPIAHADAIRAAVMITQGLDDKVVPPSQAEQIVEALERNGVPHFYLPLEGEGHGYRRRESLLKATRADVSFYAQVFGYEPADDVERIEIRGL